jgi:predicted RNA-binding protein
MTELWARVIERWGFPVLVALAAGFVLRNDVLIPLVEEHRIFLRQLGDTQKEISGAIQEQTRLLYRFAPRDASAHEIEGGGT